VNHAEALQYLANVANDFLRTLPPSAQGPTSMALNEAVQALAPLVAVPDTSAMVDAPRPNGDAAGMEGRNRKNPAAEPVRGE
jgi:hypothetical protein